MINAKVQLLVLLFALHVCNSWIVDPGPQVIATKGEVWPKPQHEDKHENYYIVSPTASLFNIISEDCSLLQKAKSRYLQIILENQKIARKYARRVTRNKQKPNTFIGYLTSLDVSLTEPCAGDEYPHLYMNENYTITIPLTTDKRPLLEAKSIWGIIRGLDTFSQSIYTNDNDQNLYINATSITDYPRFSHRGLLLDTSRHYLLTSVIYKQLDAMSYNKLNVLHWHIVDDQSFPFKSVLFPELSDKGAYHPKYQIYTPDDVQNVIEYARLRGIRVIPEFDTPGHTRSWGEGVPDLLTQCYEDGKPTDKYGPMNPSRHFLYSFLFDFFRELRSVFPEKYFHLGGDEVPYDCWMSNPDINHFMDNMNISGDYKALQKYYMERLLNIISSKDITGIIWEEAYSAGTILPKDAVVHVWYSDYSLLKEITSHGSRALYSSCWYLDHLSNGGDWMKFYRCDPERFGGTPAELKRILGGEACMWGEVVDSNNVLQRTWPRASAVAEKLWSPYNADTVPYVARRLEEHSCRLNKRNIPAQPPNGPGYCLS